MIRNLLAFYYRHPLWAIIFIALFIRLLAVFFSKGYGMHDDHFSVIEAAKSWADGTDYGNWLPWNQKIPRPEGHSFFYVGLHYLLFIAFKHTGISSPETQMLINRFLHAILSMVTVILGFRIVERYSNVRLAGYAGLLLAALWFMPFLSVRNLVEVVATPLLLWGLWILIRKDHSSTLDWLWAGVIVGLAFSVRFQTIIFAGGIGLVILFLKKWKPAFIFFAGILLSISAIQGVVDMIIWQRPFAELTEYIRYNLSHSGDYGTRNVLMYLEMIPMMLVPPLGLFLFAGAFIHWKSRLLLFIPTMLFLLFHTIFPNKQERFIFTVIPMFVMLGVIGWSEYSSRSVFWNRHQAWMKLTVILFIILNTLLLVPVTTAYSKKARVESALYLGRYKNLNSILIQEDRKSSAQMIPISYANHWFTAYLLGNRPDADSFRPDEISPLGRIHKEIYSLDFFRNKPETDLPQFVLFCGENNLNERISKVKILFPDLEYETRFDPGFVDNILFRINPVNYHVPLLLYRTNIGDYSELK